MDDLISRQAAIRFIRDKVSLSLFMKRSVDKADKACMELCDMLDRDLPTAQKWIPCNERLPEYDGDAYLVTDYCEQINRKRIHVSYCYINKEGFWSDVPLGYKVIAWMPLPEPWRGEGHG